MAVVTLHSVHTESQLNDAVATATRWLDDEQNEESFWVGMLESNSCIEAGWLLAMHFVGYEHPRKHDLVQSILNAQRADGAWQIYHDAPNGDINSTVECYVALKAVGMSADDEPLVKARRWIFSHGGLSGVRVFTHLMAMGRARTFLSN
ncbi:MAG: hypothetical protein VCC36_01215 [Gammaproteobacteria bacterium]|jgi:squalene-hopene/tetraprenyl-beta-curcumene cyclase